MTKDSSTYARTTVTAALPYANGPIHIGHLAGVYVPADVYVRYLRLNNRPVLFVCGSDEHGVAITIKAKKEGLTPQQLIDKYHALIRDSLAALGISFDIYDRTSDPLHHETASGFFRKFWEEGKLLEQESEQFYDEEAAMFLPDRYVAGTCPKCGYDNAYGDQCEKCGSTLSATELINPRSTVSGKPPVMRSTSHWYFPLNDYQQWLEQYILEDHRADWKPNVYGQCKSWLNDGLQPRAITRDLDWGIPVPVPGAEGKVLYVWFDAPIGYISATRKWAQQAPGRNWEDWWKRQDTRLVHFIGKDNIVFHSIIFPAMLKGHGEYIWADQVPANEFLNLEGQKISTSRNWAIWLHEYLEDFPGKEDVLRYALLANLPETKDNDFTWKDLQARNNNELVATLGNFVHRAVVLTHKYYTGVVPAPEYIAFNLHADVLNEIAKAATEIGRSLEAFRMRDALAALLDLARAGNKYLADTEPWKLWGKDNDSVATILYIALQLVAALSRAMEPFLPFTANKLAAMLGLAATPAYTTGGWNWLTASTEWLPAGTQLAPAEVLFQKIEDPAIEAQVEKLKASQPAPATLAPGPAPEKTLASSQVKPMIDYEAFSALDIRVCTIQAAEPVTGADKLLKLTVDDGTGTPRTIVSGIALHYRPADLPGRRVVVLLNLQPRKLRGILSEGMVLMAESPGGKLTFITPEEQAEPGTLVK